LVNIICDIDPQSWTARLSNCSGLMVLYPLIPYLYEGTIKQGHRTQS